MHDRLTCPLSQRDLVAQQFMEHRTKVLDVAAFLDRLDRSVDHDAEDDFRLVAFRRTLSVLTGDGPDRVERIQMILSDPRTEPLEDLDRKGALGAYDPNGKV